MSLHETDWSRAQEENKKKVRQENQVFNFCFSHLKNVLMMQIKEKEEKKKLEIEKKKVDDEKGNMKYKFII